MNTRGVAQDAHLTAIWLPSDQLDRMLASRLQLGDRSGKSILARAIETDSEDLVLFSAVPGLAGPPIASDAIGQVEAGGLSYRRRFPPEIGRLELFGEAPYLFCVRVYAPLEWQQPLRDWLDQEHFARQTAMDGVFHGEGYEPLEGPFHLFNLWAIRDPDVIDSPEWIRVRASSWYDDVVPGFQASVVRREIYRIADGGNNLD